jgi:hypothetical protein
MHRTALVRPLSLREAALNDYVLAILHAKEEHVTIKSLIRTIPHYPRHGVMFRDITTLLNDAAGFERIIEDLGKRYAAAKPDKVAGIESRGFIIGGALAFKLGCGRTHRASRRHGHRMLLCRRSARSRWQYQTSSQGLQRVRAV